MQVKLKISIVLFLAASFVGVKSYGQEEVQTNTEVQELSPQHPELNLNDDKTLLMDSDAKASKIQPNTSNARESAPMNAKPKSDGTTKPSASEKNEEDPLSFNFLYFIIQKFKISDIVDD